MYETKVTRQKELTPVTTEKRLQQLPKELESTLFQKWHNWRIIFTRIVCMNVLRDSIY